MPHFWKPLCFSVPEEVILCLHSMYPGGYFYVSMMCMCVNICIFVYACIYICIWASLVAQRLKCLPGMQETWVPSLGWEDPLEKEMATHSSTLVWRIPWREEPGRLQSMGSQSVGHDWATSLTYLLYFFCRPLIVQSLVLPICQCLKIVISYILSIFLFFFNIRKTCLFPVSPS